MDNKIFLKCLADNITSMRVSKSYRAAVFFKRARQQLLHGDRLERKDFLCYIINKLLRKNKYACRPQNDFDWSKGVELIIAKLLINNLKQNLRPGHKQIAILTKHPYQTSGGGQRAAQLAKTFTKQGYDVLYFYAADNYYNLSDDIIDNAILHLPIEYVGQEIFFDLIHPSTRIIFEYPSSEFLPYIRSATAKGYKTIYEHIDNWDTSLGTNWFQRGIFLEFIESADVVVATCAELKRKLLAETNREIHYVANAVDKDLFNPNKQYNRPLDLRQGSKTLLYYGHLSGEWLNWDLVFETALACPDCAFNIIGTGKIKTNIRIPSNVYLLGAKEQVELPAYLCYSDIALLPFRKCAIGKYISPLKMFEYISMNVPVLSNSLPDISDYPNTFISDSLDDWIKAVRDGISTKDVEKFVMKNCWDARCNKLLELSNS